MINSGWDAKVQLGVIRAQKEEPEPEQPKTEEPEQPKAE